jgi:RNA polymerase sigma factor (sigma-70 family)
MEPSKVRAMDSMDDIGDRACDVEGSITANLRQLKGGDLDAAQFLWERYYHRLVALARKKLGDSSRRTMDEDDVVQIAFSSFCLRAKVGCFSELKDRDSLWALLAFITARKAANQRVHEHRVKRGGGRTSNSSSWEQAEGDGELMQVVGREPSPDDAALFVTQLEQFMHSLQEPTDRIILLWKLEERTNQEIARHLDCSLSAVERRLRFIRKRLRNEISEVDD